jgi:hypothetical protein
MTGASDMTAVITGAPRSGTYLLYRLLDDDPMVLNALTQVYLLEYLEPLHRSAVEWFVDYFFDAPINELLDDIHERELLPVFRDKRISTDSGVVTETRFEFEFDEAAFSENLESARPAHHRTVDGLWRCWFDTLRPFLAGGRKSPIIMIKSPDYGRSAHSAERFLENFKAIFVVRDPVFALSSLRKLRQNQTHGRKLTTLRMLAEIENYRTLYTSIDSLNVRCPEAVHVVRFEDLVEAPRATMDKVASFLEIPYSNAMLQPTVLGRPWSGNSSFEPLEGISRKPLTGGHVLLSKAELKMLHRCLGSFLERYGYERDNAIAKSASTE